jgi:hypothetical protein
VVYICEVKHHDFKIVAMEAWRCQDTRARWFGAWLLPRTPPIPFESMQLAWGATLACISETKDSRLS